MHEVLPIERNPVVVDVGANPLEDPAYKPLMTQGLCDVVGFEPQESAYQELLKIKGDNETYFPLALGNGTEAELNIYSGSGLSSVLSLSEKTRAFLGRSKRAAKRLDSVKMRTSRLDDIEEITNLDLLKIDVQGAEVDIFENGREKLRDAVMIISEVRFYELYEGEHLFDEQIRVLRSMGFSIHKFMSLKSNPIHNSHIGYLRKRRFGSQLLDGDCVFLMNLRDVEAVSNEQLCCAAILADAVVESFDVTLKCLEALRKRNSLDASVLDKYVDMLPNRVKADPLKKLNHS